MPTPHGWGQPRGDCPYESYQINLERPLVTHFNRQTFEEGIERERRFSVADVEAVINTPEFYRDGNAYFNGV